MPPKPRKIPKVTLLGLTCASLLFFSTLLPDAYQLPVMAVLFLGFVFGFNYFLRHP